MFRLALALHRTVAELRDEMSWEEFQCWAAFDAIEPIGGRRDDLLAAHWMATFVNMHRDREKNPEPHPITDFLLVDKLRESAAKPEIDPDAGAVIEPRLLLALMAHAKKPKDGAH